MECVRSYAWSKVHSDLDLSSVKDKTKNAHLQKLFHHIVKVVGHDMNPADVVV